MDEYKPQEESPLLLPQKDLEFLDNQNEKVHDQSEFADIIDTFDKDGYGRAIVKAGSHGVSPKELVGYILPSNDHATEHIVLMKDKTIMVLRPDICESEAEVARYSNAFSPNEKPMVFHPDETMFSIAERLGADKASNSVCVFKNDRPNDLAEIGEAVDRSMRVAVEIRVKKEAAREQSVKSLVDKARTFFGKSENPNSDRREPPMPPPSLDK